MRLLATLMLGVTLVASASAQAPAPQPPSVDLRSEYRLRIEGLGAGPVVGAGDVSGDGIRDALVADAGAANAIAVVYGRRAAWRTRLFLQRLRPHHGYRIARPGAPVSSLAAADAGDVSGDGVPDALVGYAPEDGSVGEAYVVFGQRGSSARTIDLTQLTPRQGYRLVGAPRQFAGTAVANAGDVNGDGVPDALVGAPGPDGARGAVYVVYGRRPAPAAPIALATLVPGEGYRVDGAAEDRLGRSVANIGDVNRDGVPDALLSAHSASHSFRNSGSVYVVYGRRNASAPAIGLDNLGAWGYRIDGAAPFAFTGWSVADAGDVNRDGVPDMLVGAPGPVGGSGSAHVVFGRASPPGSPIELRGLAAEAGYRIEGRAGFNAGYSVAGVGDLSRDGVPDALVGAPGARGQRAAGAAYVVYGQREPPPMPVDLGRLAAGQGYVIGGLRAANAGTAVAEAGDVDGDGVHEAWIWAPVSPPAPPAAGAALLVGRPRPFAAPRVRSVRVGWRTVRVPITCSAPRGSRCIGAVRLLRARRIVGAAGFSIGPSGFRTVRVRLSPSSAALLRRRDRLTLTLHTVTVAEPPAPAALRVRRLVLLRRR